MNSRIYKVVAGLALENEIHNRRSNQTLSDIYCSPNPDAIRALHDQLIASKEHFDREVAFWLELAMEQMPISFDLHDLDLELREMEVLLSDLLWRVDSDSQRDLNDWLNYLANVAQSVRDGYGLDAKTLMSLAAQTCTRESIEKVKRNPSLGYKITVLQSETIRLFEEIKKFPLRLEISEERLDAIIDLQGVLIDLLRRYCLDYNEKGVKDLIRYPIEKLELSQRYLMRSGTRLDEAKREIELASEYLELQMSSVTGEFLEQAKSFHEKIKALAVKLPKTEGI